MSFFGEFNHTLDPKNRVFIPAKFREELGSTFVLCQGPDDCLFVYSEESYNQIYAELYQAEPSPKTLLLQRRHGAGSHPVEPDKQGRITIPQKFCDYASFERDLVIVGVYKRIEIWSAAKWEEYNEKIASLPSEDVMSVKY